MATPHRSVLALLQRIALMLTKTEEIHRRRVIAAAAVITFAMVTLWTTAPGWVEDRVAC